MEVDSDESGDQSGSVEEDNSGSGSGSESGNEDESDDEERGGNNGNSEDEIRGEEEMGSDDEGSMVQCRRGKTPGDSSDDEEILKGWSPPWVVIEITSYMIHRMHYSHVLWVSRWLYINCLYIFVSQICEYN
jgi:hypothetical protein